MKTADEIMRLARECLKATGWECDPMLEGVDLPVHWNALAAAVRELEINRNNWEAAAYRNIERAERAEQDAKRLRTLLQWLRESPSTSQANCNLIDAALGEGQ